MAGAGRVIASCFALCAFAVAIAAGLSAGNEPLSVLGRAILAMIICYPAGFVVATICGGVVQRHLDQHRAANPIEAEQAVTSPAPASAAMPDAQPTVAS